MMQHVFVMHQKIMSECATHGYKRPVFVSSSVLHMMLMCFFVIDREYIYRWMMRMMRDIVSMEYNSSFALYTHNFLDTRSLYDCSNYPSNFLD